MFKWYIVSLLRVQDAGTLLPLTSLGWGFGEVTHKSTGHTTSWMLLIVSALTWVLVSKLRTQLGNCLHKGLSLEMTFGKGQTTHLFLSIKLLL
jgi:hypothetical protein